MLTPRVTGLVNAEKPHVFRKATTMVASRKTCGFSAYDPWAALHVGPVAVQRILRIPVTAIVQVPALTGTNIGLAQPGVWVIRLAHGGSCPAPSGWRRGALRSGPRGPISEAVALLPLVCRRAIFLLNKKGLPYGRSLRWGTRLGMEVARTLIHITSRSRSRFRA